MYPKIIKVEVLEEYFLKIYFDNGEIKKYDFTPNLKNSIFLELKDYNFFKNVKVDIGGCGISWSDDLDLSEYEVYKNGISI